MEDIRIIFDEGLCKAFRRAKVFCDEEGVNRIEAIILVGEFLHQEGSTLYEYLWMEHGDSEYIYNVLDYSIQKVCDKIRDETNKDDKFVEVKVAGNVYSVSNTVNFIINWIIDDQKSRYEETLEEVPDEPIEVEITSNVFVEYILLDMPTDVLRFLRRLDIVISELKDFIVRAEENIYEDNLNFWPNQTSERYEFEKTDVTAIPLEMVTFLKDITDEVKNDEEELILGRDKETQKIWDIISKKKKRNAIMVGEPGVGKTAIIEKMAADIHNKMCPEKFQNFRIISLDMTALIANTTYRGQAEERFNKIKDFLEKSENVILFIDEIHTMLGAGTCRDGGLDFANSMKPLLARDTAIVIGATTFTEYRRYFSTDAALNRRFEKVTIREPKVKDVYPMLANQIKNLEEFHNVRINKSMVEFIIFTASCFNYETRNPDRTLDLIDRSMVVAQRMGKTRVDKKCVLKNYDINFKMFQNTAEKDKKGTAYHEAGHFIMKKYSKLLNDSTTIAVSIMPAENYLGVNAIEENDESIPNCTLDYFIDEIACQLAGRVAERMFTGVNTAGASSDLNSATKTAYEVITKYALVAGYNFAYINEENIDLQSEEVTNRINKSIEELLKKAEERAESVLKEHEEVLNAVVEELFEKKMLSKKDLDKICKRFEKY